MAIDARYTMIGMRLRQAREYVGYSQGQVALKFDVHRPTISAIEAGLRTVSITECHLFMKLYKVSFEYVMTGVNPPVPESIIELTKELSKTDGDEIVKFAAFLHHRKVNKL